MDTNKQYIKMCEKAEEIRKGHKWQDGDYTNRGLAYYSGRGNWNVGVDSIEECIWLPRQDQLQEMIGVGLDSFYMLWHEYEVFASCITPEWADNLDSMEQLWLAFVMKEKYNKVWVNDEWVKREV